MSMAMMFLAGYIYANRDKDVIYLGKHIVLEKKKEQSTEKDIEELKTKIEDFMRRYSVVVKVETTFESRNIEEKIVDAKAHLIITS